MTSKALALIQLRSSSIMKYLKHNQPPSSWLRPNR
jgi:hypothetical protein